MATTSIEWADSTWNPVTGCDKTSPGCANCYAATMAKRLSAMGHPRYRNDGNPTTSGAGFAVTCHPDKLDEPRHWRKPRRVFVNSMSDLFHPQVPGDYIQAVFNVIEDTPQHSYQILTKRSKRLAELADTLPWPDNLWAGVSIETQNYTFRADHLRQVPAAIRFISAEPLLGPLEVDLSGIDWLIVGGESGAGARPIEAQWVRDLRDNAIAANTAFFFKQWAGFRPKQLGRELDGRTWDQYPTPKTAPDTHTET